ncbi:hypothetical protein FA13DRAFT_1413905 [Coprinellus micaceus]|uniref:Uncharacterized protein n=1 Tax=Coprinellus micaceus TaxID=71717 RepID=A0A4Y7SNG1_COPMI|nr:hypothetical protein FA13DRAFT_1413905 [Coprinellus micaceus]
MRRKAPPDNEVAPSILRRRTEGLPPEHHWALYVMGKRPDRRCLVSRVPRPYPLDSQRSRLWTLSPPAPSPSRPRIVVGMASRKGREEVHAGSAVPYPTSRSTPSAPIRLRIPISPGYLASRSSSGYEEHSQCPFTLTPSHPQLYGVGSFTRIVDMLSSSCALPSPNEESRLAGVN